MAIAPFPQIEELERLEQPWPKPTLRLVPSVRELDQAFWDDSDETEELRLGLDVAERRRRRASARVLRRRLAVTAILLGLVVALALPLRALGTVTISGQQTPGGTPAGLMDGSVYTVQPGDTLASIAQKLNPSGDQAALIGAMAAEVGSHVVVAGEHVQLP